MPSEHRSPVGLAATNPAACYFVLVRHTMSIRLDDEQRRRLQALASRLGEPPTALAARLVDEGLRMAGHPFIVFRPTPTGGRVAGVADGPDVVEVMTVIGGLDATGDRAIEEAGEWLGLHPSRIRAAVSYAAAFEAEIRSEIESHQRIAADARTQYDREQALLR